jgi:pimeloyl-ACP methyl ester carboxylesterase
MRPFQQGTANAAERTDLAHGFREIVAFFGPGPEQMFGMTHIPIREPRGGVIICSPVKLEQMKNYTREVVLARSLARRGFAVQRFHYRGTGHSDGDSRMLSLHTMIDDASAAAARLAELTAIIEPAYVGTRVGSMVAAAVAAEGSPLVMWLPITDPKRYLREVLRAGRIASLKGPVASSASEPARELSEPIDSESVDVLGFTIDAPLRESLFSSNIDSLLSRGQRPILLLDVNKRGQLRTEYAHLADRLHLRHFDVDVSVVRHEEIAWWFFDLSAPRHLTGPIVTATTRWLERRIGEPSE